MSTVLHPNQFQVNEAWIAFRLNETPVSTSAEGDFNIVTLMDAASCFILSSTFIPTGATGPSKLEARRLLSEGQAHKQELPVTLFISSGQPAQFLADEAERQGITVVHVPDDQLVMFVGEAREGFRERFGGERAQ